MALGKMMKAYPEEALEKVINPEEQGDNQREREISVHGRSRDEKQADSHPFLLSSCSALFHSLLPCCSLPDPS